MSLLKSLSLPLGSDIIPFVLRGVDGDTYSIKSFSKAKVLVIIFTCNHCPYAQAAEPFIIELAKTYIDKGVQFVAINPNDAEQYPDDSYEQMQERAVEFQYPYPYLQDATQNVASAYQAQCTPDTYVYNEQRTLAYHGRINNVRLAKYRAKTHELQDALEALINGEQPSSEQLPSMGCSIKWKKQ